MIAEDRVPIEQRYLMLTTKLSSARFDSQKAQALAWCEANPSRLDSDARRAAEVLSETTLTDKTLAFIQCHCYADIPAGRVYDTAFMLAEPSRVSQMRAELRVAIFWRGLPMLSLEHGHHHLVVFDFPNGVPVQVNELPTDRFDGDETPPTVGLCDASSWEAKFCLKP